MSNYGYHYGGKINRGERYGKVTSRTPAPKANLGEGHSAKPNKADFSDLRAWYAKQDQITKSAMNKAADNPTALFSKEERDSFYRNVDADHYQQYLLFRYPGKTEFIQDRMKSYRGFRRNVEENGLVPKEPSETKPETQYAEQAVKEQANSKKPSEDTASDDPWAETLKSETPAKEYADPNKAKYSSPEFKRKPLEEQWDEALKDAAPKSDSAKSNTASQSAANSEKMTPEKQAAKQMVENAEAPAEQTKSEKSPEGATADTWFADALKADITRLDTERAEAKRKAEEEARQQAEAEARRKAEEQARAEAAQDIVNNSKPAEKNEQPTWVTIPWRETVNRIRDRTSEEALELAESATNSNSLWDFPELAVSKKGASRASNYLNDAYARKLAKQNSRMNLDNIDYSTGFGKSPARYNSLSSILGRNEPLIYGLTAAGALGLTGLGLYGKYALQKNDEELAQTQVPYRMESEPVNEAIAQAELTPEQQFVLQSTSPFDYAKGANLFDLYDRYGSPASSDNSVNDEELIDEATGELVSPQEPPALGTKIQDSNLTSPDADEAPEEINDAMRDARPGSFWKAARGAVASRVDAAKNAAQNAFGRALARSKAVPALADKSADSAALNTPKQRKSASSIRDTSNGPIVLNDPNHRKTRDVQNSFVTPEQTAASQMVNQYAGIPIEVVRTKNQPFLTTDAIWNRLRQKGLVSPEEGIRSGLFTPDEVRYITENDLWRYR